MRPPRFGAVLVSVAALTAGTPARLAALALPPPGQALSDSASRSGYAGAEACRPCHPEQYAEWKASRHSKMLQRATPEAVKAPFLAGGGLRYRGRTFRFEREGSSYWIIEARDAEPPLRHRVEYTLGNRRIQHYLARQASGALVLLPPTWDVLRGRWFPHEEIVPTADGTEPVQVWSKNCFGCHVSQERKNFDPETLTYATDWLDFGTNCETCHGPGRAHAEFYLAGGRGGTRPPIVNPRRLDSRRFTELCASCHQNRFLLATGYRPGEPFYDHFLTAFLYTDPADAPDPSYYADGRTRRFSNNSFALWQSRCFREGEIRCLDCHRRIHRINIDDNPQLRPENASAELCGRCHGALVAEVEAHSHHPAGGPGSSCLGCHMPYTVTGVKATMRDHSLSVPVPENTRDYGVPNACNLCHPEEGPDWAAAWIRSWYGELGSRPAAVRLRRRAAAFSAAQAGAPEALEALTEILADPQEPFVLRASAAGYLRRYPVAAALAALRDALVDPHPAVRAVAALSFAEHPGARRWTTDLIPLLTDPRRAVRMNAAFALARLGVARVQGPVGEVLRAAQEEYLEHLGLYADSAEDQANRGAMLLAVGQVPEAVGAYRVAVRLDPRARDARFGLGVALLAHGRRAEGLGELRRLYAEAPGYPGLAALLARLGSDTGARRP